MAVFPYARSGMVSAVMLGLGRALGETMAVAMVLSASGVVTFNLISTAEPGDDRRQHRLQLHGGAPACKVNVLIATGLVLFVVTFVVNFAARAIVGPQREGGQLMTHPTAARPTPTGRPLPLATPPAAPLGARAGRRGRRRGRALLVAAARLGRRRLASWSPSSLFLVGLPAVVARGRGRAAPPPTAW